MNEALQMRMVGGDTAEILLYGDIGKPMGGVSALAFVEKLKALGKPQTITLRIHSEGGDVFDSLAIYNMLSRHPARIEVQIDGIALSAATLVMMAGDRIRIARDGQVMVHAPWTWTSGTAAELRQRADRLDALQASVVQIYARRTKLPEARVSELLDAETWMDPAQALKLGFVDEITGAERIAAHLDRDRYRNAPSDLLSPPKSPPRLAVYRDKLGALKG